MGDPNEKIGYVTSFVLVLTLAVLNTTSASSDIGATVMRKDGKNTTFTGTAEFDKGYATFFGIRFGQPRVADQRFDKSDHYEYTEDVVPAKKHGNVCPQKREQNSLIDATDVIGEDCLYLNIIVPFDSQAKGKKGTNVLDFAKDKAVYIFIHGGVFLRGSSNKYVTTDFVLKGDFIAVTLNYRLGFFGFLSTDDNVMPANVGLWDQRLAIEWVKKNIGRFGGDSSRITIGGQSAGSMSTILQSIYDGDKGLFQNVVAESGSPFTVKIVSEEGLPTALEVAKMAGCKLTTTKKGKQLSQEISKCLRSMPFQKLADLNNPHNPIGPVLDNEFVTRETFELCPRGIDRFAIPQSLSTNLGNKNLLTGFNSQDGEIVLSLALQQLAQSLKVKNVKEFLSKPVSPGVVSVLLKQFLSNPKTNSAVTEATVGAIMEYYTDWTNPSDTVVSSMKAVDLMTDYYFAIPTYHTALIHAAANSKKCSQANSSNCGIKAKSTYFYEFRLPSNTTLSKFNGDFPWFDGTRHGAELFLLSDYPFKDSYPNLTKSLVDALTNFIKTGNPNPTGSDEWASFTKQTPVMYELTHESTSLDAKDVLAKRTHFWDVYLPNLRDSTNLLLEKITLLEKTKTNCPAPVKPSCNGGFTSVLGKYNDLMVFFVVVLNLVMRRL